jgi:hypothetical protein
MEDPLLLKLQAPNGETRIVDAHDLTEIDIAWIKENFPQSKWWTEKGYLAVAVPMGYRH